MQTRISARINYPEQRGGRLNGSEDDMALPDYQSSTYRVVLSSYSSSIALCEDSARGHSSSKAFIADAMMISDHPADIDGRAVSGHWEGDLILGLGSSAISTLVERTTRFTVLLHLPRMEGHGTGKTG